MSRAANPQPPGTPAGIGSDTAIGLKSRRVTRGSESHDGAVRSNRGSNAVHRLNRGSRSAPANTNNPDEQSKRAPRVVVSRGAIQLGDDLLEETANFVCGCCCSQCVAKRLCRSGDARATFARAPGTSSGKKYLSISNLAPHEKGNQPSAIKSGAETAVE